MVEVVKWWEVRLRMWMSRWICDALWRKEDPRYHRRRSLGWLLPCPRLRDVMRKARSISTSHVTAPPPTNFVSPLIPLQLYWDHHSTALANDI